MDLERSDLTCQPGSHAASAVGVWRPYARATRRLGLATVAFTAAWILTVRLTTHALVWDVLGDATSAIPTVTGLAAADFTILTLWATITRAQRPAVRAAATAAVLAMFPAARFGAAADGHGGAGATAIRVTATIMVSGALLVILHAGLHLVGRAGLAAINRGLRRSQRGSADEVIDAWLRSQNPAQQAAVAVAFAAGVWLFAATFIGHGLPGAGPWRIVRDAINRIVTVADGLAIGLISGAVVMWLQAALSSGPATVVDVETPPQNRQASRHASRRTAALLATAIFGALGVSAMTNHRRRVATRRDRAHVSRDGS